MPNSDQNIDLLDSTLDDLEDLPSNEPFPVGAHQATMILSIPKSEAGKPAKSIVVAKFIYVAPLELSNADAVPPKPGDEAPIFCNLKKKDGTPNAFGQGLLKMILQALRDGGIQGTTNRELIEAASVGVDVMIVTTLEKYNDVDRMKLQKIAMV